MRVIDRNITFAKHEVILQVVHRHSFFLVKKLLVAAIVLGIPFFFMFPLFRLGKWGFIIFGVFVFIALYLSARAFFIWYNNVLVLTTQRIFLVHQKGLFLRDIQEGFLEKIVETSFQKKGLAAIVFGYGSIKMGFEKKKGKLVFEYAPKPQHLVAAIQSAADNIDGSNNEDAIISQLQKIKDKIGVDRFKAILKQIQ